MICAAQCGCVWVRVGVKLRVRVRVRMCVPSVGKRRGAKILDQGPG